MIVFSDQIPKAVEGHIVILNGKELTTSESFLKEIWTALDFPLEPIQGQNWDAYLDWMRDLSWYQEKTVTIVIENYREFLCKEPEAKKTFLEDFEKAIISFWKECADTVFSDPLDWKTVHLILSDERVKDLGVIPVSRIMNGIDKELHQGRKSAHCYSIPLLTENNGEVRLACFEIALNGYLVKEGVCKEPYRYILADAEKGQLIQTFDRIPDENKLLRFFDQESRVSEEERFRLYHQMDLFRATAKINTRVNYAQMRTLNQQVMNLYPKDFRPYFIQLQILAGYEGWPRTMGENIF